MGPGTVGRLQVLRSGMSMPSWLCVRVYLVAMWYLSARTVLTPVTGLKSTDSKMNTRYSGSDAQHSNTQIL